jgi:hypothetical protein
LLFLEHPVHSWPQLRSFLSNPAPSGSILFKLSKPEAPILPYLLFLKGSVYLPSNSPSRIFRLYPASSGSICLLRLYPVSSGSIQPPPTLSYLFRLHPASSDSIQPYPFPPASSNPTMPKLGQFVIIRHVIKYILFVGMRKL